MSYMDLIEREIGKLAKAAEARRGIATPQEVATMANLLYVCRHYHGNGEAAMPTADPRMVQPHMADARTAEHGAADSPAGHDPY